MNAPANIVADWTADPRVRSLVASIAKHHPRYETRFATYAITRDEWGEYVGYRVECLERIYAEYFDRVKRPATADGDWSEFDAFMAQPAVQDVVHDAVFPPAPPEPPFWETMLAGLRPGYVIDASVRAARQHMEGL